MIIDVHAHHIPENCLDLDDAILGGITTLGDLTDVERRMRDMESMGVDMQVLSVPPGLLNRDRETSRRLNQT